MVLGFILQVCFLVIQIVFDESKAGFVASCAGKSICAYQQNNSEGISVKRTCGCKKDYVCGGKKSSPVVVNHGIIEQYLYCAVENEAGEERVFAAAPLCTDTSHVAHSQFDFVDNVKGKLVATADVQRCQCPIGSKLDRRPMQRYKTFYSNLSVIAANYSCVLLPICTHSSVYEEIHTSDESNATMIRPMCRIQTSSNHSASFRRETITTYLTRLLVLFD